MTLYEALSATGRATSKNGYDVQTRNWSNAYERGWYYIVARNGRRIGSFPKMLDVLRIAADVDTLGWESVRKEHA